MTRSNRASISGFRLVKKILRENLEKTTVSAHPAVSASQDRPDRQIGSVTYVQTRTRKPSQLTDSGGGSSPGPRPATPVSAVCGQGMQPRRSSTEISVTKFRFREALRHMVVRTQCGIREGVVVWIERSIGFLRWFRKRGRCAMGQ
jgi:hypothetical protein